MKRIAQSAAELVGSTPMLKLNRLKASLGLGADIFAKLEFLNPAGSVKDRVAKRMLEDAFESGRLKSGGAVIEPTSGNTGIGIAAIAASMGLKAIIVMPETMSLERRKMIAAYGAKLVLTDGSKGMTGAIEKAGELQNTIPGSLVLGQFENPSNPKAHYETTGPEIYKALEGDVDIFVSAVGTGGTITGVGRYLKERIKKIRVVAVEPDTSAVLSGEKAGRHAIQGIGAGFVPDVLDTSIYDEIIRVTDSDAFTFARLLGRQEGVLAGISSGAAAKAACVLAEREENRGKRIAVIFPDGGDRYMSTPLFDIDD